MSVLTAEQCAALLNEQSWRGLRWEPSHLNALGQGEWVEAWDELARPPAMESLDILTARAICRGLTAEQEIADLTKANTEMRERLIDTGELRGALAALLITAKLMWDILRRTQPDLAILPSIEYAEEVLEGRGRWRQDDGQDNTNR